ncbi:MAG: hypothetical protein ACOYB7_18545 [Mycobacterium sp.]
MTVSIRPLLVPGLVLATAGAVALGPALIIAPASAKPVLPTVHVEKIQLAGVGQDIYNAVTPYVQYTVGGVSYIVNFLPIVGAPIAAQININYFQGIQPIVAATVNYLAGVVQNPLNFVATTAAYGAALYDIAYNWVSAQAVWIGLPPLPPLPAAAAVTPRTPAAQSGTSRAAAAQSARRSPAGRIARATAAAPEAAKAAAGQSRKTAKPARAAAGRS